MVTPEEILGFWLDDVGPEGWYKVDDTLDAQIRDRFGDAWQSAMEGRHAMWLTYPSGTLAYLILLDQFPRNMFRNSSRAFATDKLAVELTKYAISSNFDADLSIFIFRAAIRIIFTGSHPGYVLSNKNIIISPEQPTFFRNLNAPLKVKKKI